MAREEGMALAPWGALGGGKFKTEEQRKSDAGRKGEATEVDIQVSKVLEKIAARKNTVITSVALAYVVQKTPYVFPIVGGSTVDHLKNNIEALTLQLTEEDIEEIEGAYPFDLGFPNNMLWGKKFNGSQQKIWLLESAAHFEYVPEPKVCRPLSNAVTCPRWLTFILVSAHYAVQDWRVERPLQDVVLEMAAWAPESPIWSSRTWDEPAVWSS